MEHLFVQPGATWAILDCYVFVIREKSWKQWCPLCGHMLCLQRRRLIDPQKFLLCILVGLLLWEACIEISFRRLGQLRWGLGRVALPGESDGAVRSVSSSREATADETSGFLISTACVLLRNFRELHVTSKTLYHPKLKGCGTSLLCINIGDYLRPHPSHLQKGVEMAPLD